MISFKNGKGIIEGGIGDVISESAMVVKQVAKVVIAEIGEQGFMAYVRVLNDILNEAVNESDQEVEE